MKKRLKERLTITMRQDILEALDRTIDGEKIRNRSHALEYIVSRYVGAGLDTCVILAAGKPEQSARPLLRIQNRPIIAYTIEWLRLAGIHKIVMVISKENREIKEYLGDGAQWQMHITYVEDTRGDGTSHSLKMVEPYVKDTFVLLYGDILSDLDLQELIRFHKDQEDALITLAVTACTNPSLFGVTELQGSRVSRVLEKPADYARSSLVFAGIAVCEPDLFRSIEEKPDQYFVRDVLPVIARRGEVAAYPFTGKWFDLSHADEYEKAKQEWIDRSKVEAAN